ncbi:hypothetical protein [Dictyobacter formicarum]|uniref:MotA/TolQ/ExbB proton channel domain-containing protein n=1 Tax=Dictyobacter formicarum TaxID=2778368 RepID=A0ABQ3V9N8_9CHLR|nr:hypothetical protein [Dictyobacter formicarum]GHO82597.1 hypothetical protein KSZ_06030 [Dictyobacter formicarum]
MTDQQVPTPQQSGVTPQKFGEDGKSTKKKNSYPAALVLTGSTIPVTIAAAILTAILYFSPIPQPLYSLIPWVPHSWIAILAGFAITLLLWLLSSLPFRRITTFDNANALSSHHIKSHERALRASYDALKKAQSNCPSQCESSLKKVDACLNAIDEELAHDDLRWVAGTGYLNAWNLIHRAEEAMIDIAPRIEVIREAYHDELSLQGSSIDSRNATLTKLRMAVKNLSPSAIQYMDITPPPDNKGNPTVKDNGSSNDEATDPIKEQEREARNAIHNVKQTINEFRDGLWEGLVRMRNQLTGVTLYTGLLTYVLLCTAIVAGAVPSSIEAATIYYLVGAMVGLFGRLYTEAQANQAISDYGLTFARIVVTPILSGMAAVGGVLVVAVFSFALVKASTVPSSSILSEIYNLGSNLQGIIVAAIFGLTPNLLISILQQKADDFQTQLKNSSATDQAKNESTTQ